MLDSAYVLGAGILSTLLLKRKWVGILYTKKANHCIEWPFYNK